MDEKKAPSVEGPSSPAAAGFGASGMPDARDRRPDVAPSERAAAANAHAGAASAASDKAPKQRNAVFRLLDYAGNRKALVVLGCALSAINAVLSVMPLVCVWFVVRDLIAVYPQWDQAQGALSWAVAAVAFAVASIAVYFAGLMSTHIAAFRIAANMRKAALRHIARAPLGYLDTVPSGHLRRVIDGCAGQTEDMVAHKLPDFAGSVVMPFAFVAVAFVFDPVMGLVCLIPIAVSFFALWWMMGRPSADGHSFMTRYQTALANMSAAATEYVRGIPVVKMFQQTVHSFRAFHQAIVEYRDTASQYAEFCRKPQVAQLVAINATFAVLVPAGIVLAQTTPDFATFLTDYLFYVFFSATTTTMMSKVMYSSEAVMLAHDAVARFDEILNVAPLPVPSPERIEHPADASVVVEDAVFSYPGSDRRVIDGVSLSVAAGQTVALVGPSGGGKSTLASLIPRFWDVESGSVRIGGAEVSKIDQHELMDQVAFVFQDDRLFRRSLADNVRAGRPDASIDEVRRAIHEAQCDDIVAKFPDGLDTVVGAHGVYLSGGERQRIALARAILKDAPVVVLDEATAFADPENEVLIQRALAKLCAGKTVVVIAHRLSTVCGVDCIYVIDRGRVVQKGTHDELLAAGGLYARMWRDYRNGAAWRIEGGEGDAA